MAYFTSQQSNFNLLCNITINTVVHCDPQNRGKFIVGNNSYQFFKPILTDFECVMYHGAYAKTIARRYLTLTSKVVIFHLFANVRVLTRMT